MLVLFTDTDTDMVPEIAESFGYKLISMPYSVGGETIYPYESFKRFESKAFYDMLRKGTIPTTSALGEEKYVEYFEPYFKNGDDILYVHFSRAMTASFDVMDKVLESLKAKYPDTKFYEVDTKGITLGSLNIVYEIGDMYRSGKTAEEILAWAEKEVDKFAVYFFADDLKFFKKSGRVSGLSAVMGTLAGVRPIISMTSEGKMESIGKEVGKKNAMERLVRYMEELGEDIKDHRILVGHADAPELAEKLISLIKERFGEDVHIETVVVNPTAGSHCGPNTVGVSFHAKHR